MQKKLLLALFLVCIFFGGAFAFLNLSPSVGPGNYHANGCNYSCNWDGLELSDSLGLDGTPPVGNGTFVISNSYNKTVSQSQTSVEGANPFYTSFDSATTRDVYYASTGFGAASAEYYGSFISSHPSTSVESGECPSPADGSYLYTSLTDSTYASVRQNVAVVGRGGWSKQIFTGFAGPYYCGQSKSSQRGATETGADPKLAGDGPINDANAYVQKTIYPYAVAYYLSPSLKTYIKIGEIAPSRGNSAVFTDFSAPTFTVGRDSSSYNHYRSTKPVWNPVTNGFTDCDTDNSLIVTQTSDGNMDSICTTSTTYDIEGGTSTTIPRTCGNRNDDFFGITSPISGRYPLCLAPGEASTEFSAANCSSIAPGPNTVVDSYRRSGYKVKVITYSPVEATPPAFVWPVDGSDGSVYGSLVSWATPVYVGWMQTSVEEFPPIPPEIDPSCPAAFPYDCSQFSECSIYTGGDCGEIPSYCIGCCALCESGPCIDPENPSDDCTVDSDCPSGQVCTDGECFSDDSGATCGDMVVGPGESCEFNYQCGFGSTCDGCQCTSTPDCSGKIGRELICCLNPSDPLCGPCAGKVGNDLTCCLNPSDPICLPCAGKTGPELTCCLNPTDPSCTGGPCDGKIGDDLTCCLNPSDPICLPCAGKTGPELTCCLNPSDPICGPAVCGDGKVTSPEVCDGVGQAQCGVGETCSGCVCVSTPDNCSNYGGACQPLACIPFLQVKVGPDFICGLGSECCQNLDYTCENTPGQECSDSCNFNQQTVSGTCPGVQSCCAPKPDVCLTSGNECKSSCTAGLEVPNPFTPCNDPSLTCCKDLITPDDCSDLGGECKATCVSGEHSVGECSGGSGVCCVEGPVDDCDITGFVAGKILVDNSVNLLFACDPATNDANVVLRDNIGNVLGAGTGLSCAPSGNVFTNYKFSEAQLKGIYSATLSTALCSRDIFFKVSKVGEIKRVDDNSVLVVLLLVCVVAFIISNKRRK